MKKREAREEYYTLFAVAQGERTRQKNKGYLRDIQNVAKRGELNRDIAVFKRKGGEKRKVSDSGKHLRSTTVTKFLYPGGFQNEKS